MNREVKKVRFSHSVTSLVRDDWKQDEGNAYEDNGKLLMRSVSKSNKILRWRDFESGWTRGTTSNMKVLQDGNIVSKLRWKVATIAVEHMYQRIYVTIMRNWTFISESRQTDVSRWDERVWKGCLRGKKSTVQTLENASNGGHGRIRDKDKQNTTGSMKITNVLTPFQRRQSVPSCK